MDNLGFLIPIVGGVIGYFTNWLAIKMIFKPYEPKFVFGKKLPFTPGLMAKERYALSRKIGTTVKKHVLTDDVLIDAINDKDFSVIVDLILDSLKNNENTIGDLDLQYSNNISNYIREFLIKLNEDGYTKEVLATGISNKVQGFLKDESNTEKIEDILSKIYEKIKNETTELSLNLKSDTRTVEEVLKGKNIDKLKSIIEEVFPVLLNQIRIFIEKNEGSDLDIELGLLLKKIIIDSYGKLATALINPDKLYENSKININNYLKDNEEELIKKAIELVDKLSYKEVQEVVNIIPEYTYRDIVESGKNIVQEVIVDEIKGDKILELVNKAVPDMGIRIKEIVFKIINSIIKEEGENFINLAIDKVLSIKIKTIGAQLDKMNKEELKKSMESTIKGLIKKNGKIIISGFDIDKMVEEKINTMELSEMENIVISVANKEIRSITIVGGVLGFIIGLIPLLANLIK